MYQETTSFALRKKTYRNGSRRHEVTAWHSIEVCHCFYRTLPDMDCKSMARVPEVTHKHTWRACHLSLSWTSSIQSIHPHPTSWRSIL